MRLLFVIKGLVIAGGGAERVFADVVNGLCVRGHDVDVATFDRPGQELFYPLDHRIQLHFLGAGEPGISTPRSNMPRIMRGIRRIVADRRPDAAVAFMHSTYVPIAFGLCGTGLPLILSEHTAAAHFKGRTLELAAARLAQRIAYAKTVVSPIICDEHPPRYLRNIAVVPNPIDEDEFAHARTSEPESVILCVGGLRPEKDQASLIAAFEQVAESYSGWRLRLVGDGITRQAIEAQIAASPVQDRIELPGIIRHVGPEYARAAIIAMPSRYEALPMVAIEAMASGRPVIGFTDCTGANALIRDQINGLLIDPGTDRVAALAKALDRLMGDLESAGAAFLVSSRHD